eukprot:g5219.t1
MRTYVIANDITMKVVDEKHGLSDEALTVKLTIEPVRRRNELWAAVRRHPGAEAEDIDARTQAHIDVGFPPGAVSLLRASFLYRVRNSLREELARQSCFPALRPVHEQDPTRTVDLALLPEEQSGGPRAAEHTRAEPRGGPRG